MQRLLAHLGKVIGALPDADGKRRLELILAAVMQNHDSPRDMADPLGYRAAVKDAADLLVALYGDQAIAKARATEGWNKRVFSRVVTRRLERLKREADRSSLPLKST